MLRPHAGDRALGDGQEVRRRPGVEEVHPRGADEAGDEHVPRRSVHVVRGADLADPTRVHDGDPVSERECLDLIVRDVHHRHADGAVELPELGAHLDAGACVEVRQWLVEQERVGPAHERPRQRDALPLAAGELVWAPLEQVRDADELARLGDARLDLALRLVADGEPEADVAGHREVGEERVALEDHRDVARAGPEPRDVAFADQDRALVDGLEPCDAAQERALAAARGADDHEQLSGLRLEIDSVERDDLAEALRELSHDDPGHRPSHPAPRSSCRKKRWAIAKTTTTGAVATTAAASSTG